MRQPLKPGPQVQGDHVRLSSVPCCVLVLGRLSLTISSPNWRQRLLQWSSGSRLSETSPHAFRSPLSNSPQFHSANTSGWRPPALASALVPQHSSHSLERFASAWLLAMRTLFSTALSMFNVQLQLLDVLVTPSVESKLGTHLLANHAQLLPPAPAARLYIYIYMAMSD